MPKDKNMIITSNNINYRNNFLNFNKDINYKNSFKQNKRDVFVSFKGQKLPSGEYTDEEIALAKKYLYVEDYEQPLKEDLLKNCSYWDCLFHPTKIGDYIKNTKIKVKDAILDLKQEAQQKETTTTELGEKIKVKEKEEQKNIKKQKVLEEEILHEKNISEKIEDRLKDILNVQTFISEVFVNKAKLEIKIKSEAENPKAPENDLFKDEHWNGIMLSGLNENEFREIMAWIINENCCRVVKIDFKNLSEEEAISEIRKRREEAQDNDRRTILHISNFEKFTIPTKENQKIIPKLKAFLSSCTEKYKCTIIVNIDEPDKLTSEIIADQRFKKFVVPPNIENQNNNWSEQQQAYYDYLNSKDSKSNQSSPGKSIEESTVSSTTKIRFIKIAGGYVLKYGEKLDQQVLLKVTGNGIYNNKILWIDSDENEKIKIVLKNFNEIRRLDHFKNVKIVQIPQPEDIYDFLDFKVLPHEYTQDGKPIYQRRLLCL